MTKKNSTSSRPVPKRLEQEHFKYAAEEFTANVDKCRKCDSAIWTVITRSGFREYLDPEFLNAQEKLNAYLLRNRIFVTWETLRGFEVETVTGVHLISDNGSRPMLGAHKCQPNNIRTEVVNPYTLAKVTISIPQATTKELELPL